MFDPGWFPDVPGGAGGGTLVGRSGSPGPGGTPDVPPGWSGLWTLPAPGWFEDGGVGIPNMLVPIGVACCVPRVPALLSTRSSVMELLNGGALIPDVLSAGTPWLSPLDVVLVCGTRW